MSKTTIITKDGIKIRKGDYLTSPVGGSKVIKITSIDNNMVYFHHKQTGRKGKITRGLAACCKVIKRKTNKKRIKALCSCLTINKKDLVVESSKVFKVLDSATFMVLTESEAEKMFDNKLRQHIDDFVLPKLPKDYKQYFVFDYDSFIHDAITLKTREATLATYDGEEHKQKQGGQTFYIYRTG